MIPIVIISAGATMRYGRLRFFAGISLTLWTLFDFFAIFATSRYE